MQGSKKKKSKKKPTTQTSSRKAFRCTICSYFTLVKARFTKHVKYHSMPFIKCEHCDFKTPYKWNLDRHYKNHNGEGSLSCPLCNFSCDIKQSLTVHIQNHHDKANLPENIGHLVKLSLGYCDSEEINMANLSNFTLSSKILKRRNSSSPTHQQGNQPVPVKTFKVNSNTSKSLFTKKFYKCRSCNFNALSELGLTRHVVKSHPQPQVVKREERRRSLPLPPPLSVSSSPPLMGTSSVTKPMPNLIPIPTKNPVSKVEPGRKVSLLAGKTCPVLKPEVGLPKISIKVEPKSDQGPNCQEDQDWDDFQKKSKFLEYFALTPKVNPKEAEQKSTKSEKVAPTAATINKNPVPRRRTSFFEKLTQKLVANTTTTTSHTKDNEIDPDCNQGMMNSLTITSNSTRCQYCRHRCKTSVDLISHLGLCPVAKQHLDMENMENDNIDDHGEEVHSDMDTDPKRVFVWNLHNEEPDLDQENQDQNFQPENFEDGEDYGDGDVDMDFTTTNISPNVTTKSRKVYKCPQNQCGFWATTASRFHVHIVGHYNLKPFECSQCSYRSNWRWDITKHIKLKTNRDPSHSKAKVLLTHESGQRNYRKYDRYLVPMDVTYSADAKLPDCSTVASKRPNVELAPLSMGSMAMLSPSTTSSGKSGRKTASPGAGPKLKMPKLTKAPVPILSISPMSPGHSQKSHILQKAWPKESLLQAQLMQSHRQPLPPILKPIISISPMNMGDGKGRSTFVQPRMLSGGEMMQNMESIGKDITVTPIRSATATTSTMVSTVPSNKSCVWKCKKCTFKHTIKEVVISHINQNHKPKMGESLSILNHNNLVPLPLNEDHSEDENEDQDYENHNYDQHPENYDNYGNLQNLQNLQGFPNFQNFQGFQHLMKIPEISVSHLNSKRFVCVYCNQTLASRRDLRLHLKVHGSEQNQHGEENSNLSFEAGVISPEEVRTKPRGHLLANRLGGGTNYKKYHCKECPYVTDSKGQFVYHKRFHMPSDDAPFKCEKCTYHVSHKHLLHQHTRIHTPSQEDDQEMYQFGHNLDILDQDQDQQSNMDDDMHPKVLVWKGGRPYKMFRCRFCPQVFGKLDDLTEHEDSHEQNQQMDNTPEHSDNESALSEPEAMNLSLKTFIKRDPRTKPNFLGSHLNVNPPPPPQLSLPSLQNFSNSNNTLYICELCPARFFYEKELRIHHTFHVKRSDFRCKLCSYSARQEVPHLMSHMKVHGTEYQQKTQSLLTKYVKANPIDLDSSGQTQFCQNQPKPPKLTPISITPTTNEKKQGLSQPVNQRNSKVSKPDASIHCPRCPARFNTMASFTQHTNNHGRLTSYTCRHCDYGTDSSNNLTLHAILHAGSEITIEPEFEPELPKLKLQQQSNAIFQQFPLKLGQFSKFKNPEHSGVSGDTFIEGNPEFVYPTYVKNGRVKSKRYKCFKCPSAFEKRDQYKVHMGLHGSDQRYKCTVCDYAVTYYANFIQHLKKHENQANVSPQQLVAKPLSKIQKEKDAKDALSSSLSGPKIVLKISKNSNPTEVMQNETSGDLVMMVDEESESGEEDEDEGDYEMVVNKAARARMGTQRVQ